MGERVLVHGAAGGVGIAAVQLAALAGARVTATVRNPELRDDVRAIGASLGPTDVVAPDEFTGRGPFHVVLELVGAPNMPANLDALAAGGRIAVIGVGAGATAELNLLALMAKRGRIHGSTLRARPLEQKADAARRVEAHVLPLLQAGGSGTRGAYVPVSATYPMDDAEAAYERFAAGGKLGKIVLVT
jgi:NADPH:quinone reductase-like Zn-dependent oxidoreductase